MKVSPSVELVWELAGREAVAAYFAKIESEHFLMAVLKFAELPVEKIDKMAEGSGAAEALARDVRTVREELEARSVDSTAVRRQLRSRLGKGDHQYTGGSLHRSQASRDLFDNAALLAEDAGRSALHVEHLFQAILVCPTLLMAQVLGDAIKSKPRKIAGTPLLDQYGEDLTRLAAAGKLAPVADRRAECKALLRALGRKAPRSVLLVSESSAAARSVVIAAVHELVGAHAPPGLQGKRVVALPPPEPGGRPPGEPPPPMNSLFAEAAAKGVLCFRPSGAASAGGPESEEWVAQLRAVLKNGDLQCICHLASSAYDRWVKKDRSWKRLAHVIWVDAERSGDIPSEL